MNVNFERTSSSQNRRRVNGSHHLYIQAGDRPFGSVWPEEENCLQLGKASNRLAKTYGETSHLPRNVDALALKSYSRYGAYTCVLAVRSSFFCWETVDLTSSTPARQIFRTFPTIRGFRIPGQMRVEIHKTQSQCLGGDANVPNFRSDHCIIYSLRMMFRNRGPAGHLVIYSKEMSGGRTFKQRRSAPWYRRHPIPEKT